MTARTLRSKYPKFWKAVETSVLRDFEEIGGTFSILYVKRIAHNAAFNATYEHHKAIK